MRTSSWSIVLASVVVVACLEAGCGRALSITDPAAVKISVKSVAAGFCRCMHGCGLGINSRIALDVESQTPAPIEMDWSSVRYAIPNSPVPYEDRKGATCCTGGLSRTSVPVGQSAEVELNEHFDVQGTGEGGVAHGELVLLIDGQSRTLDLGSVALATVEPDCR